MDHSENLATKKLETKKMKKKEFLIDAVNAI
jgi:hypothetical protein